MSKIKVTFDKRGFEALYKQLDDMERWEAEAGYYSEDIHESSGLPMSSLAEIHEEGIGVPERPFMSQTAQAIAGTGIGSEGLINILFKGSSVKGELESMSKKMSTQISITIEYGSFTPNSPYTLSYKRGDDPLIDSGEMKETPKHKVIMKEGD